MNTNPPQSNEPRLPRVHPSVFDGFNRIERVVEDAPLSAAERRDTMGILNNLVLYIEKLEERNGRLTQIEAAKKAEAEAASAAPGAPAGEAV